MPNDQSMPLDVLQVTEDAIGELTIEERDAVRKAIGRQIDPETAEVDWIYACTSDPYYERRDLPEEYRQIGRAYFARSPGCEIWISFDDLPENTRDILWKKHGSKLAFPAGLPPEWFGRRGGAA